MINYLSKYKAVWIGGVLTALIGLILYHIGFILIPEGAYLEKILIGGFWWLFFSLLIYKFSQVKDVWALLGNLFILVCLLIGAFLIDQRMSMGDNPLTLTLVVVFWLYLFYLLAPSFFKKYRFLIIGVYGFSLVGFSFLRFQLDADGEYRYYMIPFFILPILLFGALWVYDQWKYFQGLKSEKSKAELALLKSQINPHFFFNTLNNLYSLTVNHSAQAPEVIVKLSDMMRYTIYEGKKETVAIEEEIDYLKNYLNLHEIRYHKKVDISFEHRVERGQQISPLLFIILLENALKHGVETLAEAAYVRMELIGEDGTIRFSIENNFDPEGREKGEGIGLENLKRRLDLIYPKQYELTFQETANTFKAVLHIQPN